MSSSSSLDGDALPAHRLRQRTTVSPTVPLSSSSQSISTSSSSTRYSGGGIAPSTTSTRSGTTIAYTVFGRSRFGFGAEGGGGVLPRKTNRRAIRRKAWYAWLLGSDDMPGVLPYVLCGLAGLAGVLLPFAELMAQGIPKLAKDFKVMALHLPTRSVAKRPIEGLHFDAGELHGEVRSWTKTARFPIQNTSSNTYIYIYIYIHASSFVVCTRTLSLDNVVCGNSPRYPNNNCLPLVYPLIHTHICDCM